MYVTTKKEVVDLNTRLKSKMKIFFNFTSKILTKKVEFMKYLS